MPSPVCCIEVRNLKVVFPNGHEAIKSIDLDVPAGQFVCVIGRSGAGKSTLLRCLNGLLRPTGGSIVVDGTTVTGASTAARRRLQTPAPVRPGQPGSPARRDRRHHRVSRRLLRQHDQQGAAARQGR